MAIGEPPKKRLDQKLTDGETGNNQAQLKIRGAFFGNIDREERDDESQAHDHNRSRQGDQDQFSPEDGIHKEKS